MVVAALACLSGPMHASLASAIDGISIQNPWCLSAGQAANGAGYLAVENKGSTPDRLMAITSPAAQHVSIHRSGLTAGMSTMIALAGVDIPARSTVTFAPGGLHLMLEALHRPISVGERVPLTLWFRVAGPRRTSLVVRLRPPVPLGPSSMRM